MGKKKKRVRPSSHQHTDVAPSGLGQQLAAAPGRLAREPLPSLSSSQQAAKWAPPAAPPSACPSPAAAVALELARSAALDQLRHKFASFSAKAGLRNVPLLAFERWRFASKWAEDEPQLASAAPAAATGVGPPDAQQQQQLQLQQQQQQQQEMKKQKGRQHKQPASDPVIPFGSLTVAPEPGLVSDLIRAGVDAAAAVDVASQLAAAAAAAAAALLKKRQQLASGKAASCGQVCVDFHKHSLDLRCGSTFVKISRPAYGKLARLFRQHWISRVSPAAADAAACTVGLPPEEAAAQARLLQQQQQHNSQPAADQLPPSKRRRKETAQQDAAAGSGSSSDSDSDTADGAEQEGSSSSSGKASHLLDAEAQLAELEMTSSAAAAAGADTATATAPAAAAAAAGSSAGSSGAAGRQDFHARLFSVLLRYKSIQGHGFQAAAGPSVFDLLRQRLYVGFECFASPLNAHFSKFGSAFPDVDAPFGSSGSFFRMGLKHGSVEVNPPFVPAILTAAAQHMLQLLEAAEASGGALSFAVVMPGWTEVTGWKLLNSSSFLRQSLLLAAADHGYCDGASHQRKDLYRQSPFDSSVMFLQTSAAAKKWPVSQALLQDLQVAFAACCPSAAAAARQKKQRGFADLEAAGYGVPVQKAPAAAAAGASKAAGTEQILSSASAGAEAGGQRQRKNKKKKKRQPEA